MLAKLYRTLIPTRFREKIYSAFLGKWLIHFRHYITEPLKARYYAFRFTCIAPPRNEYEQSLREWGVVGPCPWPYLWVKEYRKQLFSSQVLFYEGLPYVEHHGRKLFFRRGMTKRQVLDNYFGLVVEQDPRSAHCYVTDYAELKDKILLDIGSAEAIFTLDVIEHIRHAYLFESEESWIEALQTTFEPWKEKITIIRKYVSDINDTHNITLDTFFADKPIDNLFLKMDIEGYERKALAGATRLLAAAPDISGAVCIYHKKDDPEVIGRQLTDAGLTFKQTPGYLYMSRELRPGVLCFRREKANIRP